MNQFSVSFSNPTSRPVEYTISLDSVDNRWRFAPDHAHGTLNAGERCEADFQGSVPSKAV
jgi:hypothetical protein